MKKEKIVVFKLSSGEEIIAKYVSNKDDAVQLRSPLRIERIMGGNSLYYTLRAWLINQFEEYDEKIIAIKNNHIMAQMIPGNNVIQQYHSTLDYLLSPSEEPGLDSDIECIDWPELPGGGRLQ